MPIHINIDNPAEVDALFDAVDGVGLENLTWRHVAVLADKLRQLRTIEDIQADNAAAQWDYDHARREGWGNVR